MRLEVMACVLATCGSGQFCQTVSTATLSVAISTFRFPGDWAENPMIGLSLAMRSTTVRIFASDGRMMWIYGMACQIRLSEQ